MRGTRARFAADSLATDSLEPTYGGAVLAGGRVSVNETVIDSFGKYKNERGKPAPKARYNINTKTWTVYHSIGHTRYVPMLTPFQVPYSDQPSVTSLDPYSFSVRFYNPQGDSYKYSFYYVCFLAD